MSEVQDELLDIVTQVRAHLEYQKALGVRAIAVSRQRSNPEAGAVPHREPSPAPAVSRPPEVTATNRLETTAVGPITLASIRERMGDCCKCKLAKGRNTLVFGEGNPEATLVFVGEGPGFEEDQQGRPFVGAAGQLLTDIIEKGMTIKRAEVYICNIVKCRPPGNRNPEPDEVAACIGFVKQQIAAIKPKVIVTLGNVPTQNLLGTKEGITKMRGRWQEYEGIPVMPTFHPSYLLRSPGEKGKAWEDIKLVMMKLGINVKSRESGAGSQKPGGNP